MKLVGRKIYRWEFLLQVDGAFDENVINTGGNRDGGTHVGIDPRGVGSGRNSKDLVGGAGLAEGDPDILIGSLNGNSLEFDFKVKGGCARG